MPEGDSLDSLQVGDLAVWIEQGPRAVLAAVIRGTPPQELRRTMQQAIETIHLRQGDLLDQFDGDAGPLAVTRPILETCLLAEYRREAGRRSRASWMLMAALLAAIAVLGGLWVRERIRWQRYVDALSAQPGLVVVEASTGWRRYRVRGLRDALARDPAAIMAAAQIDPADVDARWEPFLALDSSFVLARARSGLAAPAAVEMSLTDGVLRVDGTAPASWISDARRMAPFIAGVTRFEDRALLEASARAAVSALESERLLFEFATAQGVGEAPAVLAGWRASLRELNALADIAGQRYTVRVVGHADERGLESTNLGLSRARAAWVLDSAATRDPSPHRVRRRGRGQP